MSTNKENITQRNYKKQRLPKNSLITEDEYITENEEEERRRKEEDEERIAREIDLEENRVMNEGGSANPELYSQTPFKVSWSKYADRTKLFRKLSSEKTKEIHGLNECFLWEAVLIILGLEPEQVRFESTIEGGYYKLPKKYEYVTRLLLAACNSREIHHGNKNPYQKIGYYEGKLARSDLFITFKIDELKRWWRGTELPKNSFFYHDYQNNDQDNTQHNTKDDDQFSYENFANMDFASIEKAIFEKSGPYYSYKLAIALDAWMIAVQNHKKIIDLDRPKDSLGTLMNENKSKYFPEGKDLSDDKDVKKIARMVNWKTEGGAPHSEKADREKLRKGLKVSQYLIDNHGEFYSHRLHAAVFAWYAVSSAESQEREPSGKNIRQKLDNWLTENKNHFQDKKKEPLTQSAIKEICSIINWSDKHKQKQSDSSPKTNS